MFKAKRGNRDIVLDRVAMDAVVTGEWPYRPEQDVKRCKYLQQSLHW